MSRKKRWSPMERKAYRPRARRERPARPLTRADARGKVTSGAGRALSNDPRGAVASA